MTTATRVGTLTLERFLRDLDNGILDDRIENFAPLDAYGPPTHDELEEDAVSSRLGQQGATRTTRESVGERVAVGSGRR